MVAAAVGSTVVTFSANVYPYTRLLLMAWCEPHCLPVWSIGWTKWSRPRSVWPCHCTELSDLIWRRACVPTYVPVFVCGHCIYTVYIVHPLWCHGILYFELKPWAFQDCYPSHLLSFSQAWSPDHTSLVLITHFPCPRPQTPYVCAWPHALLYVHCLWLAISHLLGIHIWQCTLYMHYSMMKPYSNQQMIVSTLKIGTLFSVFQLYVRTYAQVQCW